MKVDRESQLKVEVERRRVATRENVDKLLEERAVEAVEGSCQRRDMPRLLPGGKVEHLHV